MGPYAHSEKSTARDRVLRFKCFCNTDPVQCSHPELHRAIRDHENHVMYSLFKERRHQPPFFDDLGTIRVAIRANNEHAILALAPRFSKVIYAHACSLLATAAGHASLDIFAVIFGIARQYLNREYEDKSVQKFWDMLRQICRPAVRLAFSNGDMPLIRFLHSGNAIEPASLLLSLAAEHGHDAACVFFIDTFVTYEYLRHHHLVCDTRTATAAECFAFVEKFMTDLSVAAHVRPPPECKERWAAHVRMLAENSLPMRRRKGALTFSVDDLPLRARVC